MPASTNFSEKKAARFLKFTFQLEPDIFQQASEEQLYQISGILRTTGALRNGTPIMLKADRLKEEIRFNYQDGLKSLLFEADYQRWALHPGCLSFKARDGKMSIECHLRFLHAGTAQVLSFVNYYPTQGGAHLEGLGKALCELFGKDARGCREVLFVTNPDSRTSVSLPHCCIGALHLRTPDPKYYGPTKDVLMGDEVRDFVYQAAMSKLPIQWESFRK